MQMGQKKRDKNPNVSQVCHVYGIPTDARQREQCHEGKRTIKQIDERKREGTEEEATINDLLFFNLQRLMIYFSLFWSRARDFEIEWF